MTKNNFSEAELEQIEKIKKSICIHRWEFPCYRPDSGEVKTCCRTATQNLSHEELQQKKEDAILNNAYNIERRKEMLTGVRHSDCNYCWSLEDAGHISPRKSLDDFLKYQSTHTEKSKEQILKDCLNIEDNPEYLLSYEPRMLEISLGNTCNLKCIYCSPNYSSSWAAELIQAGELNSDFKRIKKAENLDITNELFWSWMEQVGLKSLNIIGLIGGETFLSKGFDIFLENLEIISSRLPELSNRRRPILIQIVTNLSIPQEILTKHFEKMSKLNSTFRYQILFSMESVKQKAEFIRYGLDWKLFNHNLDLLMIKYGHSGDQFTFGFLSTLNALSISSLPEFIEFVYELSKKNKNSIYLGPNQVVFPEEFSIYNLPTHFSEYIEKTIQYMNNILGDSENDFIDRKSWIEYVNFLKNIKTSLNQTVREKNIDDNKIKFARWIKKNDLRRNTNFIEIFPEYTSFLNDCKNLECKLLNN